MRAVKFLAFLLIFVFTCNLQAEIPPKNSNDVFTGLLTLKERVTHLAGEKGINKALLEVAIQTNKKPRHVMQKSLEVLSKINKYRIDNNLGPVDIPSVPSREITSEDVYYNVQRLNEEVVLLMEKIKCPHIKSLEIKKKFHDKTPNDTYRQLWIVSFAFDELLGKGFNPTDTFERSAQIVKIIDYLRKSQNIFTPVEMPEKKLRKHPNHALYATHALMSKISKAQKKLWMEPLDIPSSPQTIITPTEVYDSMQIVIAELKRIRTRLGVERYFEAEEIKETKTPSDTLQNIEYAIALFPGFSFDKKIVQFDQESLKKTYNDVYALSEFILKKINDLKEFRGIKVKPKETIHLYGLESMHVYQKSIEIMEKISNMRVQGGLYEMAIPKSPTRKVSPNNVYELLIMIDDEISIIMNQNGIENVKRWPYVIDKKVYIDKTPSDAYFNLWKISSVIDTYLGYEYTQNDTYLLAKKIESRVNLITNHLSDKNINQKKDENTNSIDKRPKDVFYQALELYGTIEDVQRRANIYKAKIEIPKEKFITPDKVYNTLRILNAALVETIIYFGIEPIVPEDIKIKTKKTSSDVYDVVIKSHRQLKTILEDSSYEN